MQLSFNQLHLVSRQQLNLGIAQMVARYLGVVEAVGSNPATQTKIGGSIEPPIFAICGLQ